MEKMVREIHDQVRESQGPFSLKFMVRTLNLNLTIAYNILQISFI